MRTLYWYLTAYLRKHGPTLLLSVVVAVIIFSFSIPLIVRNLDRKPRRYIGLVGNYELANLPEVIQHQVSGGLTSIESNGQAVPDLAERWSIENNGTTYRFVVKKNLFWQDGKALEPSDISYQFNDVEIITTANDVVFKLPDAFVPFPTVVSQPLFRIENKRYLIFFQRPQVIGLGSHQITDYQTRGQRLTEITLESPQERLIYRFYLTEDEALLAFKHGKVDILPDMSTAPDVAEWSTVRTEEQLHYDRYLAVFFNNADPLFAKNIRQALSYALTKPNADIRATSPISAQSWAYFRGGKAYDYNMDNALERILTEIPQLPLHFELTTTTTFQADAERIKQEWEAFGDRAVAACQQSKEVTDKSTCANVDITITLRINNYPDTSHFQALLIGQEVSSDPDQYYLWHSDQSSNFTNYKNTRIDSLLERGRKSQDQNERLTIYQEFQEFFLEDAPVIFLRYLASYNIQRI